MENTALGSVFHPFFEGVIKKIIFRIQRIPIYKFRGKKVDNGELNSIAAKVFGMFCGISKL